MKAPARSKIENMVLFMKEEEEKESPPIFCG